MPIRLLVPLLVSIASLASAGHVEDDTTQRCLKLFGIDKPVDDQELDEIIPGLSTQVQSSIDHCIAAIGVFESDDRNREKRGFEWLLAEHKRSGSAYVMGQLGWAYQRGLGTEPDLEKAVAAY